MRENEIAEKGREVQFIGKSNNVLENGKIYPISEVLEGGVRVVISTGFAGVKKSEYILIKK